MTCPIHHRDTCEMCPGFSAHAPNPAAWAVAVALFDPRLPPRFWSKVSPEPNTGCWLWTGYRSKRNGYGSYTHEKRTCKAHRVAYEVLVGAVPPGTELDHVRARGCSTPACVNPAHLEPVSHRENCIRGDGPGVMQRVAAKRTSCKNGHLYTTGTVKVYRHRRGHDWRECLVCMAARNDARNGRSRLATAAAKAMGQP